MIKYLLHIVADHTLYSFGTKSPAEAFIKIANEGLKINPAPILSDVLPIRKNSVFLWSPYIDLQLLRAGGKPFKVWVNLEMLLKNGYPIYEASHDYITRLLHSSKETVSFSKYQVREIHSINDFTRLKVVRVPVEEAGVYGIRVDVFDEWDYLDVAVHFPYTAEVLVKKDIPPEFLYISQRMLRYAEIQVLLQKMENEAEKDFNALNSSSVLGYWIAQPEYAKTWIAVRLRSIGIDFRSLLRKDLDNDKFCRFCPVRFYQNGFCNKRVTSCFVGKILKRMVDYVNKGGSVEEIEQMLRTETAVELKKDPFWIYRASCWSRWE